MSFLGIAIALAGLAGFGLAQSGALPGPLADLPIPIWGWLAIAAAGGGIFVVFRKPGN